MLVFEIFKMGYNLMQFCYSSIVKKTSKRLSWFLQNLIGCITDNVTVAEKGIGAVHKRRRQLGVGEGSKIGQNCRRILITNCRHWGGGCQKSRKLPTSFTDGHLAPFWLQSFFKSGSKLVRFLATNHILQRNCKSGWVKKNCAGYNKLFVHIFCQKSNFDPPLKKFHNLVPLVR